VWDAPEDGGGWNAVAARGGDAENAAVRQMPEPQLGWGHAEVDWTGRETEGPVRTDGMGRLALEAAVAHGAGEQGMEMVIQGSSRGERSWGSSLR